MQRKSCKPAHHCLHGGGTCGVQHCLHPRQIGDTTTFDGMRWFLFLSISAVLIFDTSAQAQQPQQQEIADRVEHLLDSSRLFLIETDRPEISLRIGLQCMQYMNKLNDNPHMQKQVLAHLIHSLNRLQQPEMCMPHLYRMLEIEKNSNSSESPLYLRTLGTIGTFHLGMEHFERSRQSFREAMQLGFRIDNAGASLSGAINNLGFYFEKVGELDSAMRHYQLAIAKLGPIEEMNKVYRSLLLSIMDNEASVQEKWGNLYRAKSTHNKIIALAERMESENHRRVKSALKLARLQVKLGAPDTIPVLLRLALNNVSNPSDSKWEYEHRTKIQKLWAEYAQLIGDNALYQEHITRLNELLSEQLKQAHIHGKSIDQVLADYTVQNTQYELQRRSEMLEMATNEARLNRSLLIVLGIFSAFVFFSTYYFYRRRIAFQQVQTRLTEKELENKELLNSQLQTDLNHTEKDFSDLRMQVSLKTDWAKDVTDKISKLIKSSNSVDVNELKKLMIELKQQSGIYEKLELYQSGMEEVNAKFFAVLEERFPTLTRSEKEVCGLIRLNLDGKEIASLRNIHPSSVRKMRQRIRKKIGISEDVDIYQFIHAL